MQMLLIASLAVVVGSYFLTAPSEEEQVSEFFRMAGLTGNANGLANYARVSIILTLFFLIQKPNFFWQLVYYNIIAICFYSIIISASRSNFANGLLVIGAFYGLKYFSGARIIILALLMFIAGNVLIAVIEGFLSDFYLYDRLTRTKTIADAVEEEARIQLYLTAWKEFWKNPLFGVGLNQFKHYSGGKISHTDFLDVFVQLGFVAGILYLSIYIRIYRAIQKSKRLLVKLGEKQLYNTIHITFISELVFGLANPNWFTQLQMIFLSVIIIILYKYLPVLEKYSSGAKNEIKVQEINQ
jgi:O-antigen ligase